MARPPVELARILAGMRVAAGLAFVSALAAAVAGALVARGLER